MQIRHIGLLLLLLLLTVFGAANWTTISNPTDLNLLLGRVQAPIGLLMLGIVATMGCLYAVLLLAGERRLLRQNARLNEMLAESWEHPRDTTPAPSAQQVRTIVTEELSRSTDRLEKALDRTYADLEARLAKLENGTGATDAAVESATR